MHRKMQRKMHKKCTLRAANECQQLANCAIGAQFAQFVCQLRAPSSLERGKWRKCGKKVAQMQRESQMQKCRNAQMHKCTNAQMHKCRHATVGRTAPLEPIIIHRPPWGSLIHWLPCIDCSLHLAKAPQLRSGRHLSSPLAAHRAEGALIC